MTISQAQGYSSSRSHVLLKLAADQVLVLDWIAGSCKVNLLKQSRVVRRPVHYNPGLKVNQIITVSSKQMFFVFCIGFVIIKLRIKGETMYRKPHRKVTIKLKSKFNLVLG